MESVSNYSPGTRVRVEGLQNQPQYHGLKGVVLKQAVDLRVCVHLDQDNMDLRLKLQSLHPLVVTANECKELYAQLQTWHMKRLTFSRSSSRSR